MRNWFDRLSSIYLNGAKIWHLILWYVQPSLCEPNLGVFSCRHYHRVVTLIYLVSPTQIISSFFLYASYKIHLAVSKNNNNNAFEDLCKTCFIWQSQKCWQFIDMIHLKWLAASIVKRVSSIVTQNYSILARKHQSHNVFTNSIWAKRKGILLHSAFIKVPNVDSYNEKCTKVICLMNS